MLGRKKFLTVVISLGIVIFCGAYTASQGGNGKDGRNEAYPQESRILKISEMRADFGSLADYTYLLDDSLNQYTLEEVNASKLQYYPDFMESLDHYHNHGTYWEKVTIESKLEESSDWILSVSSKNSFVDMYIENEEGSFSVKKSGDLLPVREREFQRQNANTFSLHLPAGSTKTIYFKIKRITNFLPRLVLYLQTRNHWQLQIGNDIRPMLIGFSQGALWILGFFFLSYFMTSNDKAYLYYGIFLFFAAIHQLYNEYPYLIEVTLGDYIQYKYYIWVFSSFLFVFFALFVRSFVNAPQIIPRRDFLFKVLIYTRLGCALLSCLVLYFSYDVALASIIYTTFLFPFEIVCWLVLVGALFKHGNKIVRYFLLGVMLFIFSTEFISDIILHTTLNDAWLMYIQFFGFTFQVLFFSFALGYRTYYLGVEKERADQEYIAQLRKNEKFQSHLNHKLEQKVRERTAKIELQNRALKKQSKRLKEVDRLKSRFFANISHEFRTPLTLILGPLQKLYEQAEHASLRSQYAVMLRNGKNLLELINQLLELSQQEAGKLRLNVVQADVVAFVKTITVSFNSLADSKNIHYTYIFPDRKIPAYFDPEKLKRIVENLLSNAFKFTPEYGKIKVKLTKHAGLTGHDREAFTLVVEDTGIGIPEDKTKHIFERFYQVDSSQSRAYGGTGIGLALVHELVQLHKGTIQIESKEGKGAKFIVTLPLTQAHRPAEERKNPPEELIVSQDIRLHTPHKKAEDHAKDRPSKNKDLPQILLLEDNPDLRTYLKSSLQMDYHVLEAKNGNEGLLLAGSHMPDLIVTDLMMPGISGLEFCKKIKENQLTSHIPIIMLTAKADLDAKIAGWSVGADEYMTKPFDLNELKERIKNLLHIRKKLQEKYVHRIFSGKYAGVQKDSADDIFLQKLENILEKHYQNSNLQIDDLTKEIGMSRSQLYRKIRSLTGKSPNAFIRKFRLHQASKLLEEEYGSVAMVSDAVGFNNDSYFSKCFQQEFGHLPSEHVEVVHKVK